MAGWTQNVVVATEANRSLRGLALSVDIVLINALGYGYSVIQVAGGHAIDRALAGSIAVLACWLPYTVASYVLLRGRTIGKAIAGLRVITTAGTRPAAGAIALREGVRLACWVVPIFTPIDYGFALGATRRTLHDRAAGTRVVQYRETARALPMTLGGLATSVLLAWALLIWTP